MNFSNLRKMEDDTCKDASVDPRNKRLQVIQFLIDNESSYIDSLDRMVNNCQPMVTFLFAANPDVMNAFINLRMMLSHHVRCQDKLKDRSAQNACNFFREFAEQEILNVYSMYINSYSVAVEILKEAEKTKQDLRDFLKTQFKSSIDGLLIKPVQRFPQFILILKDILKYSPDDDLETRQLQDCLILLEHFGYQLNERKRKSDQTLEAQRLLSKLSKFKSTYAEKADLWLIRQDDVGQLYNEKNSNQETKKRCLLLMNACLASSCRTSMEGKNYEFKWCADLQHLDLTVQSMSPGMVVKTISDDNTANLEELTILKRDTNTLEEMIYLAKTLYRSYPGVLGTLQRNLNILQQTVQKTFNRTGIEVMDLSRNKTYAFLFDNYKTKQEWCIDFLMAKFNSEPSNNPAWSNQEGVSAYSAISPACFIQPFSADVNRQFTMVKCATLVIVPDSETPNTGIPHLWVCSYKEGLGEVSIFSLYSGRINLLESFDACAAEITCAEMIPMSDHVQTDVTCSMDTVWMGTGDSEILVLTVLNPQIEKRAPVHTFTISDVVVSLKYFNNRVFGGCRTGNVVIFIRHEDGVMTQSSTIAIGHFPVSTFLVCGSDILVGCKNSISVFEFENFHQKAIIQIKMEAEMGGSVKCMVRTGCGLWVSFHGKSILHLYNITSRKRLQQYDISVDLNTFCSGFSKSHMKFRGSLNHDIMCLMVSPGLLWVGTSSGIILTYPVPLNQNCDPKLIMRPNISMHGFSGSSTFFSIVPFGFFVSRAHTSPSLGSSRLSSCQKYADVSCDKTKAEPQITKASFKEGEDNKYNSLFRNAVGKIAIINKLRERQYDSDINLSEERNQICISKDENSSNVTMEPPEVCLSSKPRVDASTIDIPEPTTAKSTSMPRADSGYGSAKSSSFETFPSTPRQKSRNMVTKVSSGGLRRKSAIRQSSDQMKASFKSSIQPLSMSGSWKMDSTNSFIVISGGEGYRDWRYRQTNSYRDDEALLLAWMIKIQVPS